MHGFMHRDRLQNRSGYDSAGHGFYEGQEDDIVDELASLYGSGSGGRKGSSDYGVYGLYGSDGSY